MNLIRRNRGTPEPNDLDRFLNVVKGALAVVGGIGSAAHPELAPAFPIAVEALNQVQNAFAQRRSKELLDEVTEDLYFAQRERQLTDEQIQQVIASEQFNSALLQARLIATRTHQEEKLEALRNAILNVALGRQNIGDRQEHFLALMDRFTSEHLALLRFFSDPAGYCKSKGISAPCHRPGITLWVYQVLGSAMPLDNPDSSAGLLRNLTIDELVSAQLIMLQKAADGKWTIPRFGLDANSEVRPVTTSLGNDFLQFITAPETK